MQKEKLARGNGEKKELVPFHGEGNRWGQVSNQRRDAESGRHSHGGRKTKKKSPLGGKSKMKIGDQKKQTTKRTHKNQLPFRWFLVPAYDKKKKKGGGGDQKVTGPLTRKLDLVEGWGGGGGEKKLQGRGFKLVRKGGGGKSEDNEERSSKKLKKIAAGQTKGGRQKSTGAGAKRGKKGNLTNRPSQGGYYILP